MISIANHIKKGIEKTLDKLLRFESFQDYINERYNREGFVAVSESFLENIFYPFRGFKFCITDHLDTLNSVVEEYRFDDMRNSDIVLDIGANIGAFSILASKKAKHVFAVEPLYADIIRKNIAINEINNITVLETGLGIGKQTIRYKRRQKVIELTPLDEILEITGKCDFLKMDCEGGEWSINYRDLEGFRYIEGELHNFDGKHAFTLFEEILTKAGFEYELDMDKNEKKLCLVHAKNQLSENETHIEM
jgi:hypothetical protein